MRKTLLTLIGILVYISTHSAVINGFISSDSIQTVRFEYKDLYCTLLNPQAIEVDIVNRKFHVDLNINHPYVVEISLKSKKYKLFVKPNDTISLSMSLVNFEILKSNTDDARANLYFQKKFPFVYKAEPPNNQHNNYKNKPIKYHQKVINIKQELIDYLSGIDDTLILSEEYKNYETNTIFYYFPYMMYNYLDSHQANFGFLKILFLYVSGRFDKQSDELDMYLNKYYNISSPYPGVEYCPNYRHCLNRLFYCELYDLHVEHLLYSKNKKTNVANFNIDTTIQFKKRIITDQIPINMQQYFYTEIIVGSNMGKNRFEVYLDKDKFQEEYKALKSKIERPELQDIIMSEFEERFVKKDSSIELKPVFLDNYTSDIDAFNEFLEQNKGKVIFIDFWGAWCPPCVKEFPFSRKHELNLHDENIEFLYVCVSKDKERAKSIVELYKLGGTHLFIADRKEFSKQKKTFNISWIPAYYLIDKTGEVEKIQVRPSQINEFRNLLLTKLME